VIGTRTILASLPLNLCGCASNERVYRNYTDPDSVVIVGNLPHLQNVSSSDDETAVDFEEVDGVDISSNVNPFAPRTRIIEVAPGLHHVTVNMVFPIFKCTALVIIEVEANHHYRLIGKMTFNQASVQLWDETHGITKMAVPGEIRVAPTKSHTSYPRYDKSGMPVVP
jgi:hypothetical protein